jgi:hypothetical protein
LELSVSLCETLRVLAQIFGQSWDEYVVGELQRQMASAPKTSPKTLKSILTTLISQAGKTRPGLVRSFLVTESQIRYQSADRRYVVVILAGDGGTVHVTWQVRTRQSGTSSITYVVNGSVWTPEQWEVSPVCQGNLALLAKDGGEVLGFMAERGLLPAGSLFEQALDQELSEALRRREQARG